MSAAVDGPKLQVLICHAQADAGFARELAEGLEFDGRCRASAVGSSVPEGEDGNTERGDLIAAADLLLFVLSPAAAASPTFNWEADYANQMSKLMYPVQLQPMDDDARTAALASLTPIRFDGEHTFMEGLKALVGLLPTDIGWLQYHTALSVRARQWDSAGRPDSHLLTAEETSGAKNWTVARPEHAPKPSDLHLDFIAASEAGGTAPVTTTDADDAQVADEEAQAAATAPEQAAQSLKKANKFYAIISILLAIVAGLAAWQAWVSQQKIAEGNRQLKMQQQAAELSKVTLAIQRERIEEAIKTVNPSLCTQAQKVTNLLATTGDSAVWDINYDLFWSLYEGPMIALEQLYGTLSETERSPVADAMIAFGKNVGTRGEPYEARVAGLPRPELLEHAANVTATCKKVNTPAQN
ncbi:MAG: TIR domain-containing protein [Rhizobiales bacterium]|nr:TIR domain-containing protein [Hyphomicrobiales bacterium]